MVNGFVNCYSIRLVAMAETKGNRLGVFFENKCLQTEAFISILPIPFTFHRE
jgi:hypothetical protein